MLWILSINATTINLTTKNIVIQLKWFPVCFEENCLMKGFGDKFNLTYGRMYLRKGRKKQKYEKNSIQ